MAMIDAIAETPRGPLDDEEDADRIRRGKFRLGSDSRSDVGEVD
jgi:hypothetical protein